MSKILDSLHPAYAKRIMAIMEKLKSHTPSLDSWLASGYRTPEEQARIYAVGRAKPGQPYTVSGITVKAPTLAEYPRWKFVSNAPPYMSAHQYGLAVGFGWIINGVKKEVADSSYWNTLYVFAQTENATDITKDVPQDQGHIQSKAWYMVKTNLTSYVETYKKKGISGVYEKLTKKASGSL